MAFYFLDPPATTQHRGGRWLCTEPGPRFAQGRCHGQKRGQKRGQERVQERGYGRGRPGRPMRRVLLALAILTAGFAPSAFTQPLPKPEIHGASWVYAVRAPYSAVRDDLQRAIEEQGLVISYNAELASMLQRTSDATGAQQQVYASAESMLFCSATLTYELTLSNPHNATLCPYSIAIYSLSEDPQTVYLAIPAPALDVPGYAAIHQLLETIVGQALSWYR